MFYQSTSLRFIKKFACIGPQCEDMCCTDLKILLQPQEVERLSQAAQTARPQDLDIQNGIVEKEGKKFLKFVQQGDRSYCAFLAKDKFCGLHSALGHNVLPKPCRTYPRAISILGENLLLSGLPSCPEIARLLLLAEDSCEIEHGRPIFSAITEEMSVLTFQDRLSTHQRFFQVLNDKHIAVVKDSHDNYLRLFCLLSFTADVVDKNIALFTSQDEQQWSTVVDSIVDSKIWDQRISRITIPNRTKLFAIFLENVFITLAETYKMKRFTTLFESVTSPYAKQDQLDIKSFQSDFEHNLAWLWKHHKKDMQLWIRNYLLFALFTKRFHQKSADAVEFYRRLLVCFWLFHLMFVMHPHIHSAIEQQHLTDQIFQEKIVEVVQIISRFLEHGSAIDYILQVLDAQQLNRLVGLLYLNIGLWRYSE